MGLSEGTNLREGFGCEVLVFCTVDDQPSSKEFGAGGASGLSHHGVTGSLR
jgi:hypothetical protein